MYEDMYHSIISSISGLRMVRVSISVMQMKKMDE